jgi:hypothetical protein
MDLEDARSAYMAQISRYVEDGSTYFSPATIAAKLQREGINLTEVNAARDSLVADRVIEADERKPSWKITAYGLAQIRKPKA